MKIRDLEWWIIGILGIIAFLLAIIGFNILFTETGIQRNLLDLAFQSMKIFGMEFVDDFPSPLPWQLEVARWLAPSVLLYTAGKAVMYFIRREFKSFFLQYDKDHIIITSLNEKSRYLVADLLKQGEKVIVLAGIENPKKLDHIEKEGAVIVEGDITSTKFLKNIAGHKARYFVFLEDNDELNISNAISVYNYLTKFGKDTKQIIYTHVADDIKLNELLDLNFFENYLEHNVKNMNCEIRIISMFERTARILFNEYSPDKYRSIKQDSPKVNVAIFGSGNLAQSMIIRLARLGHYANLRKIKITLFHNGDTIIKKLHQNFPGLYELIEFENINEPLELFDVLEFNFRNAQQLFDTVYLLCEDDALSSNILKKLIKNDSQRKINVLLTLMNPSGILSKWYQTKTIGNIELQKYNLIEESFTKEALISEKIDELAKIIHQDYLNSIKPRNIVIFGSGELAIRIIKRLAELKKSLPIKKPNITLYYQGGDILTQLGNDFTNTNNFINLISTETNLAQFDSNELIANHLNKPYHTIYMLTEEDKLSYDILTNIKTKNTGYQLHIVLGLMNYKNIPNDWNGFKESETIKLSSFSLNAVENNQETFDINMPVTEEVKQNDYLYNLVKKTETKTSQRLWDELAIDFKNQNREQADHILVKIRLSGYEYGDETKTDTPSTEVRINPDLVELLSEIEHNRWEAHMILSGWKMGKTRDDKKKIHTDLIPYADLSEDIKQYDRDTIQNIPKLLDIYGKKIVLREDH